MKPKENIYSGVWLDHANAYVMNVKNSRWQLTRIRSNIPSLHRATSGSRKSLPYVFDGGGNDHKNKNRIQNAAKSFYGKIEKLLPLNSKIYILGPSLAKKELSKYLEKHRRKKISIETSAKLTQKQFVAMVKEHFHLLGQLEEHV